VRWRAWTARWRSRAAIVLGDRLTLSLVLVFLVGAAFYIWTAANTGNLSLAQSYAAGHARSDTTFPFSLAGGQTDPYNELAKAFLHLHLFVGTEPAGQLYGPGAYQAAPWYREYADFVLYHGHFYLTWGPTPALVLLVPLHLLGLAASSSLAVALFAIAGLAFALAALRVLLREFDAVPLWMGILAAAVLVCSTTVPFLLRSPAVYEEAIAGGYCFVMAGVYLAVRAIARRAASLGLLALMSLCFGLAVGSRPPLAATGLLLVPVYMALRGTRPQRRLIAALAGPFGACLVLLFAYNYARFGSPLEVGQSHLVTPPPVPSFGKLSYLLPNLWYYGFSPPRPTVLFPFLALTPPPYTYPLAPPPGYLEITGGLFAMTPLVLFAFALPWLRLRRPRAVGALASPLLIAAAAGLFALLFVSYEINEPTERYETDFAAVFLFAALAAWFALSTGAPSRRRQAVRILGAVFAVWGCVTAVAISFTGNNDLLRTDHPGTWNTLENATSPIATAIAMVAGHPILGRVEAPNLEEVSPVRLTTLGAGTEDFSLPVGTSARLTIVSPDRREAALVASVRPEPELRNGATLSMRVTDASRAPHEQLILGAGPLRLPVELNRGLNRVQLTPVASAVTSPNSAVPASGQLLIVTGLTLASRY
jgi:hypothetical protein